MPQEKTAEKSLPKQNWHAVRHRSFRCVRVRASFFSARAHESPGNRVLRQICFKCRKKLSTESSLRILWLQRTPEGEDSQGGIRPSGCSKTCSANIRIAYVGALGSGSIGRERLAYPKSASAHRVCSCSEASAGILVVGFLQTCPPARILPGVSCCKARRRFSQAMAVPGASEGCTRSFYGSCQFDCSRRSNSLRQVDMICRRCPLL